MFYVHDFGQIAAQFRWEYDRFFHDRWCREAYDALLNHPERTLDPDRADFFVIAATLRCVSFAALDNEALERACDSLASLRTGKKHVVFDLTDQPQPIVRGSQLIVCKSAWHEQYYDPATDVSIPQFPRYRFDRPIVPASQRRHLAGFKGNPRPEHGDLRTRLLALDDGERLVIQGGVFRPEDIHISDAGEVREVVRPGEWSYEELLFNSTFALLPRACGYALSYRMIECMNAGCVPVIISDGYVLPFSEELDYDRFSIRVAERDVERVRQILEDRLNDADRLQANSRRVYETYFASTDRIIAHTMRLVADRVAKPRVRSGRAAPQPRAGKTLAVILNHNLPDLTDALHDGAVSQRWRDCDVVVMDSGSDAAGVSRHTRVRLPRNLRFGGALNHAFGIALEDQRYDSLLFLNNDLILQTPDLLGRLRAAMAAGFTIVSPCIDGVCAWPQMRRWSDGDTRPVPWVDLMAPLFHRRFIEHVRAFDDELAWGWGIEVLSGLICAEQGWKVAVCDAAAVHHIGRQTLERGRANVDGQAWSLDRYRRDANVEMCRYFTATGRMNDMLRLRQLAAEYRYGSQPAGAAPKEMAVGQASSLPDVSPHRWQAGSLPHTDDPTASQRHPDVYPFAGYLAQRFGCGSVISLGCAAADQLVALAPELAAIGIDDAERIEQCRRQYPAGLWMKWSGELEAALLSEPDFLRRSVIICCDLMERASDPRPLLRMLRRLLDFAPVALVGAPGRGYDARVHDAAPASGRRWSPDELGELLGREGLRFAFTGLTATTDRDVGKRTALAVLENNHVPARTPAPNSFRVVALVAAYNEEDIIVPSLSRLIDQGVEVYLIDNWSTDGTVERAESLLGRGLVAIERFPPDGPPATYDWGRVLQRKDELGASLDADWFIHFDVDEERDSPWPGVRLRDAIYFVDRCGFDAIDHTVLEFPPIDNSYRPGGPLGEHFRHFEFGTRSGHFLRINAWKNRGTRVGLADHGGHRLRGERRVFPYKFLLRHFPIRSQSHGERKVFADRQARWNAEERSKRWHFQYDHVRPGHCFLRRPEELEVYDAAEFARQHVVERLSGVGIGRERARAAPAAPVAGQLPVADKSTRPITASAQADAASERAVAATRESITSVAASDAAASNGVPPVFVLGMHRSGTSAVAGLIHRLGVSLGPSAHWMPTRPDNPKGFWENLYFSRLNEHLLQLFGGTWHAPPALPDGWCNDPRLGPAAVAAREYIRQFLDSGPWANKDPRACLTFPFWRAVVARRPVIVLVHRSPLEVADSLARRDGFTVRHSLALWEHYLRSALPCIQSLPTIRVRFDELMRSPVATTARLKSFLSKHGVSPLGSPAVQEIESFVDGEPRARHRTSDRSARTDELTPNQRTLLDLLDALPDESPERGQALQTSNGGGKTPGF